MTISPNLKPHNFLSATIPLICLITLMATSIQIFGSACSQGPNQVALFICTILAVAIGLWRGMDYDQIEAGMIKGISVGISACLILLFIGALISVWMLSGTVPTLIYYGVQIINPEWFYLCTLIVCALVSISIGSSWSTCATIGVAFIGMSVPLNMSVEVTAGAVISGAYFGDKMSPLSETTNLAAAVGEVSLFSHIRNMLWTTTPSLIIAAIIFFFIGINHAENITSTSQSLVLAQDLAKYYDISIINLIPLAVLIGLTLLRLPILIIIFLSTATGAILALILQGPAIATTFNHADTLVDNLLSIWRASYQGIEITTPNADLNKLLSGGGMNSMLNTIFLVIAALSFGSAMEVTGSITYMISHVLKIACNAASLLIATVFSCIGLVMATGDQYMSIIMPGRMYKQAYKKMGLGGLALSRNLEDGATITSCLIPWSSCGVFVSGVLGVPTLNYLPYCFFNILSPIMAITFAIFGIKIVKSVLEEKDSDIQNAM